MVLVTEMVGVEGRTYAPKTREMAEVCWHRRLALTSWIAKSSNLKVEAATYEKKKGIKGR
jgi:hypothetical protein